MSFELRLATPVDAVPFADCIDAAYASYRNEGLDLPPVSHGVAEDIRDNIVWLAIEQDQVLGGVILSVSGKAAHLVNVAVDPGQSGRGIGRALITAATASAREAGHTRMKLATHRDMPANVALYEHLGWHVTGTEGTKVLMELNLS